MVWPDDYIAGTGRTLPLDYNLNTLGVDYSGATALQDWADMVNAKELATLTKGEILLVPKGILHEETTSGSPIIIEPINDSADYWAGIVCEDPADKARLQISNDIEDVSGNCAALYFKQYSRAYDIAAGITTDHSNPAGTVWCFGISDNAKAVGCTNNNVSATSTPNAVILFHAEVGTEVIDCAYDQTKTIKTSAVMIGLYGYDGVAVSNSVFNNLYAGVMSGGAGQTITATNVICQGNVSDFDSTFKGGTITQTTCLDSTDPIVPMEADGYTPTADPGDGTDLSADFTDDINGNLFDPHKIGVVRWLEPLVNLSTERLETAVKQTAHVTVVKTNNYTSHQTEVIQ